MRTTLRVGAVARAVVSPLAFGMLIGLIPPAGAFPTVAITASRNGATVEVSGQVAIDDGPLVTVIDDPTGDLPATVGPQLAGDLTKVSLSTQADGDLIVRWSVASLSGEPNGTSGMGRLRFRAGGANYEVAGARNDHTGASTDPGGWLMRCGATACSWNPVPGAEGTTVISRDVGVTLDFNVDFIQATVPIDALAGVLAPGSLVQPYVGSPSSEAATAVGQLEAQTDVDPAEMTVSYPYGLSVWLAADSVDADPMGLDYALPATVHANNVTFEGSLQVPSGQAVFAKACLGGPTNCAYGHSDPV